MIREMKFKIIAICFCFLGKTVAVFSEDTFRAERLAIDFNLPDLAENRLRNHLLDKISDSAQARKLLAEVYYLKHDFDSMLHMLDLIPQSNENAYLAALHAWYTEDRIQLIPLLFCPQSHKTGGVLANYNEILYEPVNSIHWTCFWENVKLSLGEHWEDFYRLALGMKFSMFPVNLEHFTDIETVIPILYSQKRFKELIEILQQKLLSVENKDKARYFLALLRAKHASGESIENDILNASSFIGEQSLDVVDVIFTEWISTIPTSKARIEGLKNFHKIYKKKGFLWHGQYLELLQVNGYIDMQDFKKAKKLLDANLPKIDQRLQYLAYELYAKYALYQTPVNYRSVADYLQEAKKHAENVDKKLSYSRLQAECYCLCSEYDRAYYTYQEVLPKAEGRAIGHTLAEEWILCGILCGDSKEELEQQFQFCKQFKFLTKHKEQELYLIFLRHLLKEERLEEAMPLLQSATFQDSDLIYEAKLLLGQGYFRSGEVHEALNVLRKIQLPTLSPKAQKEYCLWCACVLEALQRYPEATSSLEQLFERALPDEDVFAQGKLLQAQIFLENHQFVAAKSILMEALPQINSKWEPDFIFQAGCYAEQAGSEYQEEAIALFQRLYDRYPQHPLSKDGRIKQGILLMNLNQMKLAHAVLTELLPELKDTQNVWCRYLIQKCNLMSQYPIQQIQNELELLLQSTMPIALRLEIALQLALIYKEESAINRLQKLLWDETYPLLCDTNKATFSVDEAYWLGRCLLTLAQNTADKNTVQQIYKLIMDAQLPIASLVKQFIENE